MEEKEREREKEREEGREGGRKRESEMEKVRLSLKRSLMTWQRSLGIRVGEAEERKSVREKEKREEESA